MIANYFEKMFNYYNKLKTRIILNRSGRLKPTKIIIIPNKRENIITESWFLFVNIDIVLIEMTIEKVDLKLIANLCEIYKFFIMFMNNYLLYINILGFNFFKIIVVTILLNCTYHFLFLCQLNYILVKTIIIFLICNYTIY